MGDSASVSMEDDEETSLHSQTLSPAMTSTNRKRRRKVIPTDDEDADYGEGDKVDAPKSPVFAPSAPETRLVSPCDSPLKKKLCPVRGPLQRVCAVHVTWCACSNL